MKYTENIKMYESFGVKLGSSMFLFEEYQVVRSLLHHWPYRRAWWKHTTEAKKRPNRKNPHDLLCQGFSEFLKLKESEENDPPKSHTSNIPSVIHMAPEQYRNAFLNTADVLLGAWPLPTAFNWLARFNIKRVKMSFLPLPLIVLALSLQLILRSFAPSGHDPAPVHAGTNSWPRSNINTTADKPCPNGTTLMDGHGSTNEGSSKTIGYEWARELNMQARAHLSSS